MADDHDGLSEHVEHCILVLQVLRGLNKKYDHIKTNLKRARPFPSFHDVRNDLLLEELTLAIESLLGSATALAAPGGQQQRPSPTPAQQCRPPSSLAPFSGLRLSTPPDTSGGGQGRGGGGGGGDRGGRVGGGGHRRHNRSGGGGGAGGTGGDSSTGGTTTPTTGQGKDGTPWPSFYNPWAVTINMWPGPSNPLVPSKPPHAFFAAQPMRPPFTPPLVPLPLPHAPPPQQ
jgi:hypothetical protein